MGADAAMRCALAGDRIACFENTAFECPFRFLVLAKGCEAPKPLARPY